MRIIAGTHRSRIIKPPDDSGVTRPITDRVKQALFDRLVVYEAMGGNVVDVFAGTGSLGLESLSREADHCTFIERDRKTKAILEENLKEFQMTDRSAVLAVDALSTAWVSLLSRKPVRLVFLDPPYPMWKDERSTKRIYELIAALASAGVMEPDGLLSLRTDEFVKPQIVAGWNDPVTYNYGSMSVHFYVVPS